MDTLGAHSLSPAAASSRGPGPRDFNAIRIALASPEKIRYWSFGEVTKPETINYRTFKLEPNGLYCAKIFGPITDWECLCGKYKRMKHRGVVCDTCGVEVTKSKVRRERMGHIELAAPVSHIWFSKDRPSRIGQVLDLTLRDLERILYFEAYVVIDPGPLADEENILEKVLITEERYREFKARYGPYAFVAKMGAEAIQELLQRVNIDDLADELRLIMKTETSALKRLKAAKRLKVVDAFRRSGHRPEWMILNVIPVIPPELRPLVPPVDGRFGTSDLNDLYRRVIHCNNDLKEELERHAPEVFARKKKRMLQEAVDALFDNGRRGRVLKGTNNRPLKSLSDSLKGKSGRFRQNLLGKRVDYSGRCGIIVGPELKLHQCGLPKRMALELFKPFIYRRLEQKQLTSTIKMSKELVEQAPNEVWNALEEVIKEHPVLLNRAPTLHRLGIQAFEPVLIEGKAIKIHPLVCAAFDAFDGDQMVVHVPLSPKAQVEAQVLMLSSHNILSPAHGKPLTVPSQDLVLGLYYLTRRKERCKGEGRVFPGFDEVLLAHGAGELDTHAGITVRYTGKLIDLESQVLGDQDIVHAEPIECRATRIETTVGRVLMSAHLPKDIPFINGTLKKKGLQDLVYYCFVNLGLPRTVEILDIVKELGFTFATRAGISIGIDDLRIPAEKSVLVEKARRDVIEVDNQRMLGALTDGERHNKIIDIWYRATEAVADEMFKEMRAEDAAPGNEFNSVFMMADSGACSSKEQFRQLAGMRGPVSKPSGEVMEQPIISNFREGLSVLEYFMSTHDARKGLEDIARKTVDPGFLTRRLVDVAHDVIVNEEDCATLDGITVTAIVEGGEILEPLRDRIVGRYVQEDVYDPASDAPMVEANDLISEEIATAIQEAGIERVKIRSVLTCETRRGVCRKCYGRNLATGRMVDIGEAVGVIAAQSIGEPGTQLTMRTFHYGGTARVAEAARHMAKNPGVARILNALTVRKSDGTEVVVNCNSKLVIQHAKGREKERYSLAYGSVLKVSDGEEVKPGQLLVSWDPFASPILSEIAGKVVFRDIIEGENLREETDKVTGKARRIVVETTGTTDTRAPQLVVLGVDGTERRYALPIPSHLMVSDGDTVNPGDALVKKPVEKKRTRDIVGGLPRVVELFEACRPKEPAVITEVSGVVRHAGTVKGQQKLVVESEDGQKREILVPRGAHVMAQEGERVEAGDSLTEGDPSPHDILAVKGEKELQRYMTDKIQEVYRSQGVGINDKHIEVIVRQMMRSVRVEEVGDTEFLIDEQVDKFRFREENDNVIAEGGKPAQGRPLLLGITEASLSTDSFISAASFQGTTGVLIDAAIADRIDLLRGLKENVIVGRLIPAGTGMECYRDFELEKPEIPDQPDEIEEPYYDDEPPVVGADLDEEI